MKKLEIKVDGKLIGTVEINRINKTGLSITANNEILPNGNWLFTPEELEQLITNKMQKDYAGHQVEIIKYSHKKTNPSETENGYCLQ